jgi:hypothetical protein
MLPGVFENVRKHAGSMDADDRPRARRSARAERDRSGELAPGSCTEDSEVEPAATRALPVPCVAFVDDRFQPLTCEGVVAYRINARGFDLSRPRDRDRVRPMGSDVDQLGIQPRSCEATAPSAPTLPPKSWTTAPSTRTVPAIAAGSRTERSDLAASSLLPFDRSLPWPTYGLGWLARVDSSTRRSPVPADVVPCLYVETPDRHRRRDLDPALLRRELRGRA